MLHAPSGTDIHFSAYVPDTYDGLQSYALFVTLPGWEGLYFQGAGENLRQEGFAQESIAYDGEMVVLAPQLDDWGQTSADQAVELVEHFLEHYNVDPDRVLIEGYSAGGETLSLMLGMRPELFAAALAVSSQWDGDLEVLAAARTPLRLFTGRTDNYYGSSSFAGAAERLRGIYAQMGLAEEEIDGLVVLDVREPGYFSERGYGDQHAGGLAAAFDEEVMGWLFIR